MRVNYIPNVVEDKAGRIFKKTGGIRKFELKVRYYDECGNFCTQPQAKSAQIVNVNGFAFNDQTQHFKSRREIKEAAYMFLYRMYHVADGIATQ